MSSAGAERDPVSCGGPGGSVLVLFILLHVHVAVGGFCCWSTVMIVKIVLRDVENWLCAHTVQAALSLLTWVSDRPYLSLLFFFFPLPPNYHASVRCRHPAVRADPLSILEKDHREGQHGHREEGQDRSRPLAGKLVLAFIAINSVFPQKGARGSTQPSLFFLELT